MSHRDASVDGVQPSFLKLEQNSENPEGSPERKLETSEIRNEGNSDVVRPALTIFFQLDPFNPTIGGIQTCIKYILKYAPSDFRIRLVGITHDEGTVGHWQTAQLHGREFDFLPLLKVADDNVRGLVPTTVKYALALRRYLKTRNIPSDFYQFHRIEPTVFASSLKGCKLLYIHNDIYQEVKGNQKGGILWKRFPWAYFALERRLVAQFDRILSCNSESVRLYQQQYPQIAQRVSYLRNTYDGELFFPLDAAAKSAAKAQLAQKLKLNSNTRFILFAGRLHPQKQPALLIQAMAQLKAQLSATATTGNTENYTVESFETHLLIVGKGELESQIRNEISQHQLNAQVTLLGSLPHHELADLYKACDVFVLTSAYEGLARGSLEALACGMPVVTTRAGETPNFLEADSGLVCEDATPDAIAQAWRQVLQQPEAFPAEACTRVARPFEARRVVEGLYGELLAQWQASEREVSEAHTRKRQNAAILSEAANPSAPSGQRLPPGGKQLVLKE